MALYMITVVLDFCGRDHTSQKYQLLHFSRSFPAKQTWTLMLLLKYFILASSLVEFSVILFENEKL